MALGSRLPALCVGEGWRVDCVFNGPSCGAHKTRSNRFLRHASRQRKLDHRVGLASVLEQLVRRPVVGLLFLVAPPAVAWFIVPVVIKSIKRRSWRPLPHVGEKVVKDEPPLAQLDAPFSVMFVACGIGSGASRNHVSPRRVGWRWWRGAARVLVASPQASAGLGVARSKLFAGHHNLISALAPATPPQVSSRTCCGQALNGYEPAESLANKIFSRRHHRVALCLTTLYHLSTTRSTVGAF